MRRPLARRPALAGPGIEPGDVLLTGSPVSLLLLLSFALSPPLRAQAPAVATVAATPTAADPQALLQAVDAGRQAGGGWTRAQLTVQRRNQATVHQLRSLARDPDRVEVEVQGPGSLAGTRLLLVGDEVQMQLPNERRAQRIRGDALDQGVLGSDLGYLDLLAAGPLADRYDAVLDGVDTIDTRPCQRLALRSRQADSRFPRVLLWVDAERGVALREERFGADGALRRRVERSDLQLHDGRWVAMTTRVDDQRLPDARTELRILSLDSLDSRDEPLP